MKLCTNFRSTKYPLQRSFFMVPRYPAMICGFWPQSNRSVFDVFRFIVSSIVVAIGAFGENIYGFVYLGQLTMALEAFCPGVTKLISLLKMFVFFIYREDLYLIVQRMRALMFYDEHPEKMHILRKCATISSIISFILLMAGSTTNMFFSLRPLVLNALRLMRGEETKQDLPFNIILPEMLLNYPLYPLSFIILTISGAMTVFTFSAVDGFFMCACMYICGLFRVLQYDMRIIFDNLQDQENSTPADNVIYQAKLSLIVLRHNEIIDLCSDFASSFTLIILMHFLSAAIVLCLSILDLMLNSASIGLFIYASYSIAALTQLFIYCIGGNYVSESSLEIADTMYFVDWYKCDVKTRKMILMIMRRSQKFVKISAPFFTPSLPAFRAIISTAGSYIALLKTFL